MNCPNCGKAMEQVTYPGGMLNRDQWEATRAGDWACDNCPDNGRGRSGLCYWWEREVVVGTSSPPALFGSGDVGEVREALAAIVAARPPPDPESPRTMAPAVPVVAILGPAPVVHRDVKPENPAPTAARILALDLATTTGWALLDAGGGVTSGALDLAGSRWESHGMRLLRLRRWLREILLMGADRGGPLDGWLVAFERPVGRFAGKSLHGSGEVAQQMAAIVMAECETLGVAFVAPTAAEVKKHAAGKGNADKPKMVAAARRLVEEWGVARAGELGDDEADALCVLAWARKEVGR